MAKRADITAAQLRAILDYNPETGEFRWKHRPDINPQWNGRFAGKIATGSPNSSGYIRIAINGISYRAHRLAWLWMTGEWPENIIDHDDCNASNNKWYNLRPANKSENGQNQRKRRNKRLPKGVSFFKRDSTYRASIKAGGKFIHIGYFKTELEAAKAYADAARLHFGKFARTG